MEVTVARDPFARGEFLRGREGPGCCEWCGRERLRLYSYTWTPDGFGGRVRVVKSHSSNGRAFCNFGCFKSYSL